MLKLQRGDSVAYIAPASGQRQAGEPWVDKGAQVLKDWGLNIVQMPLLAPERYLASPDAERAQAVRDALTDPQIRAIFVTRGGYGCARLLPYLQSLVIPSPRFLVGFSDVTTLHLQFEAQPQVINVHASNLATQLFLGDSESAQRNRDSLHALLFHGELPTLPYTPLLPLSKAQSGTQSPRHREPNHFSYLRAPKTGGCLSLLATSLGTAHEIQTRGKVLMIEEVCEAPYKIDRMLTHLKNAGKFDAVSAVVFGDLTSCDGANISALDAVQSVMASLDCPVYHSPTFGHGALNLPWIYGELPADFYTVNNANS